MTVPAALPTTGKTEPIANLIAVLVEVDINLVVQLGLNTPDGTPELPARLALAEHFDPGGVEVDRPGVFRSLHGPMDVHARPPPRVHPVPLPGRLPLTFFHLLPELPVFVPVGHISEQLGRQSRVGVRILL